MKRHEDEWIEHEVKEITFYVIFGIFMSVLLPLTLGFIFKGFEESFVQGKQLEFGSFLVSFLIYYIWIFVGLIALPSLKIREMFLTQRGENVAKQKKPNPFSVAILHDPENDGALYNLFSAMGFKGKRNPMRFSLSMLRMFIIGTIVFGTLGLFMTFTSTPQLAFQITNTMKVLFSAEPASFAETTLMIFVLSILLGLNAYIVSKLKLPVIVYWMIALLLICPIIGVFWMGIHNIVHGNSEIDLFRTFIFGWIGSIITVLFGTFILWWSWHFWNNVFFAIKKILPGNEDVVFISIVILVILIFFWILGELILHKYRKGKRMELNSEPRNF